MELYRPAKLPGKSGWTQKEGVKLTAADKILTALEESRVEGLKQQGLSEMEIINPSEDCLSAIEAAGGKVISKRWEQWCISDTCAHNSHDGGAQYAVIGFKEAWKPSKRNYPTGKLFEDVTDEVILLVFGLGDDVIGIFEVDHGRHFGNSTVLRQARKV